MVKLIVSATGAVEPLPSGFYDVQSILVLGNPAKDFSSLAGICNQAGRVTLTAGAVFHGSLHAGYFLSGINDFLNGKTLAGAEVEPVGVATLHQVIQSAQVSVGQVVYVDVVTNAGAVRGVVVGAEYGDSRALALDGLKNNGDEV